MTSQACFLTELTMKQVYLYPSNRTASPRSIQLNILDDLSCFLGIQKFEKFRSLFNSFSKLLWHFFKNSPKHLFRIQNLLRKSWINFFSIWMFSGSSFGNFYKNSWTYLQRNLWISCRRNSFRMFQRNSCQV